MRHHLDSVAYFRVAPRAIPCSMNQWYSPRDDVGRRSYAFSASIRSLFLRAGATVHIAKPQAPRPQPMQATVGSPRLALLGQLGSMSISRPMATRSAMPA